MESTDSMADTDAYEAAAEVSLAVGARVRERRTTRGMTLKALAEEAGLKAPFLSQLERGLATPSMLSLYRIARALDATPGDLMPPVTPVEQATVVRAWEGRVLRSTEDAGSSNGRLLLSGSGAEISEFNYDAAENNDEWFDNSSDTVTYVISGHLDVQIQGGELHALDGGDAVFYHRPCRSRWTVPENAGATRLLHIVINRA